MHVYMQALLYTKSLVILVRLSSVTPLTFVDDELITIIVKKLFSFSNDSWFSYVFVYVFV